MLKNLSVTMFLLCICLFTFTHVTSAEGSIDINFNEQIKNSISSEQYQGSQSYVFDVPEEGVVTIDSKYVNRDYAVNIYTAGTSIHLIDHYTLKENSVVKYALKPGSYRISISALGGTNYSFKLSFEAGKQFDAEPNDTFEEGKVIPPNTKIKGFANFNNTYYKDVYIIEAPTDKKLVLHKSNAEVKLYSKDGAYVFTSAKTADSIEINVKQGTYYFEVFGDNYEFSYEWQDVEALHEVEPNNSLKLANTLAFNKTYNAYLGNNTDLVDYYTFTVDEPTQVDVELTNIAPQIMLYDETGDWFASDTYKNGYSVALKPGTYTFKLSANNVVKGEYSITLRSKPVSNVSLEPNETFEQAQPIEIGQQIEQTTSNFAQGKNYFVVNVPADGVIKLETSKSDMYPTLYDANHEQIVMQEDQLTYSVGVKKGTYYIYISMRNMPRLFKVSFTEMPVEFEGNDSKLVAQPLAMGVKTRGYLLSPDYIDVFKLDVTEKGTYALTLDKLYHWQMYARVTVTNEQDEILFENNYDNETAKLVLEKGTYYVSLSRSSSFAYDILWEKQYATKFSDVGATHRYIKEISTLNELGVINGYSDGTFKPNDPIKRHHVAAMLVRSKAPKIPTGLSYKFMFKDVPRTHPNFESVHLLADGGIVDANPAGFKPNNTITRAQMAKMLVLAFGLTYNENSDPLNFKDVKEGAWYKEYVEILASHNITTGSNGYFNPNEQLSRQHFSVFLHRTLETMK